LNNVPGGTSSHGDAGLIAIEPGGYWAKPLSPIVVVYGSGETALNTGYGIVGPHYTPNAEESRSEFVVCGGGYGFATEGAETGLPIEACGAIRERAPVDYPAEEGGVTYPLVIVNMCSKSRVKDPLLPGTSGGPFVKSGRAYGTDVGSVEGPSEECLEAYEPIHEAEAALHVHVARLGEG
jgi:hypothetical protein